jgi:hypothetical protein
MVAKIPNVDRKKGKHSHFFGEITIKAIPPIYIYMSDRCSQDVLQPP